jgi:uncharacterized membrane protein YgdD (TMEM256/DUF423 family)
MTRIFFILGALMSMAGVVVGAFGAHALKERLGPEAMAWIQTGVQYHFIHALALLAAAWAAERWPGRMANAAGWLFLIGIVIFSGTLYAMALGAPRWLGAVTPIGGTAFIVGWLLLALAAWRH